MYKNNESLCFCLAQPSAWVRTLSNFFTIILFMISHSFTAYIIRLLSGNRFHKSSVTPVFSITLSILCQCVPFPAPSSICKIPPTKSRLRTNIRRGCCVLNPLCFCVPEVDKREGLFCGWLDASSIPDLGGCSVREAALDMVVVTYNILRESLIIFSSSFLISFAHLFSPTPISKCYNNESGEEHHWVRQRPYTYRSSHIFHYDTSLTEPISINKRNANGPSCRKWMSRDGGA